MLRVFAYLQRHPSSGIFYYRETVPARLRGVIGKTEIKKSLGTGRKTEAIRAAQLLHAETIKLFESAERLMTPKKAKPVVNAAQTAVSVLEALKGASDGIPDGSFGSSFESIILSFANGTKAVIKYDEPAEEAAIAAKLLSSAVPSAPIDPPKRIGRPKKEDKPASLADMVKAYFDEIKLTGTQQPKTIEENMAIFQLLQDVTKNPLAESIGLKASNSRFGRVELLISSHPAQAGLFSTSLRENPA